MVFQAGALWNGNRNGRPRKEDTIQKVKITWDVKQLAKEKSRDAIETLVEIMGDKTAGAANRLAAANAILDRGYGKPVQQVEATVTSYERMSDNELLQFLMGDVIEGVVLAEQEALDRDDALLDAPPTDDPENDADAADEDPEGDT
jgi:hypothetical protein